MTRLAQLPLHRVAAGMIGAGLLLNVAGGALGLRTICMSGREHGHIDHPLGRAAAIAAVAVLDVTFLTHYLNRAKWPVR